MQTGSSAGFRRVFRGIATTLAIAGLIASVVAVAAIHTRWVHDAVIVAAAGAPVLLACGVFGAITAAPARRPLLALCCVLVVAVGAWTYLPLFRADSVAAEDNSGTTIRVLQTNITVGGADPAALVDLVRARQVDIVTVEELTESAVTGLRAAGLDELLPHSVLDAGVGAAGTGIYSRFPLSDGRQVDGMVLANLRAEVDTGTAQPLTVYAVHPLPGFLQPAADWAADLEALRVELAAHGDPDAPVIVSGDFNATWSHRRFRDLLATGYADAADQTGAGLTPSYPTDKRYPAMIGLDHLLTRAATVTSLERVELPGADHYGLLANIDLAR